MPKKELTQGSIITNIRSNKYPDIPCYGIVITARCDFAQQNVTTFYVLTALPIRIWADKVLPDEILNGQIKNKYRALIKCAKDLDVDIDSFVEFDPTSFSEKIDKQLQLSPQEKEKLKNKHSDWKTAVSKVSLSEKEKKKATGKESVKNKLSSIFHNSVGKICFIPEYSYHKNPIEEISSLLINAASLSATVSEIDQSLRDAIQDLSVNFNKKYDPAQLRKDLTLGLIVDVTDICCLDIADKECIENGEYNFDALSDLSVEKAEYLNSTFYLASPDDSVNIAYQIDSPWIEFIMQHFSTAFIRIGVEVASDDTIAKFCEDITKDWRVQ